MKFRSEENTYKDGKRIAAVVYEFTEEEDRRALSQVQNSLAYELERKKAERDPENIRKISARITELKETEKRLMAAIAGYPDD